MDKVLPTLFSGQRPGVDSPAVVSIQPYPALTLTNHLGGATAVTRIWEDGDEARCRLCPREKCKVYDGVCMVGVMNHVPTEDAPLLDTHGRDWIDYDKPAAPKPAPEGPRLWEGGGR